MRHEVSVDVEAPASVLWSVVADPTQWPFLSDSFTRVTTEGEGPIAVGQRYVVRQPGIRAMPWTVTEVDDGVAWSWQASMLGVRTVATHRVEPAGGGARLHLSMVMSGLLARPIGAIGGAHYRALVDREAVTMAGAAEHRAR